MGGSESARAGKLGKSGWRVKPRLGEVLGVHPAPRHPYQSPRMLQNPTLSPTQPWRMQLALLLISVAITLVGVLRLGWDAGIVILIYWMENLIIGFWQLVKIISARSDLPWKFRILGKTFMSGFFTLHFGGFCGAHGLFILVFITTRQGEGDLAAKVMKEAMDPFGPWVFLTLLWGVLKTVVTLLPTAAWLSLTGIFLTRGMETWRNFFANGEWKSKSSKDLMTEPYKHIVVVHVAIILCGTLVMALGSTLPLLVGIVVGKLAIDLRDLRRQALKA